MHQVGPKFSLSFVERQDHALFIFDVRGFCFEGAPKHLMLTTLAACFHFVETFPTDVQ